MHNVREAFRGIFHALREDIPWRKAILVSIVGAMIFVLGFLVVYVVVKLETVVDAPSRTTSTVMPTDMPGMNMPGGPGY